MLFRNPFAQSTSQGPANTDPGKLPPMGNTQNIQGESGNNPAFTMPDNNQSGGEGNNNQGGTNNNNGKQGQGHDPLNDFSTLWDNPTVDPKNPPKEFKGYLPEIDPAKFQEQLAKLDFYRGIPPETLEGFFAGGDNVRKALPDIINHIGRQAFSAAFNAGTKMTDHGVRSLEKRFQEDLIPGMLKDFNVKNSVFSGNDLSKDPRYAPLFDSIRGQFATKYPKLSPAELDIGANNYVKKFIEDATKTYAPKQEKTPQQQLRTGESDAPWDDWIQN